MNALIQLFTAMAFKKNKQFVEQNKLDHTKAYNVTKDLQPVLSVVNDVICGTCSDEVDAALVVPHQHVEAVAPVAPVVVIEEEVVAPPTVVEVVEVVAEEEAAVVVTEEEEVVETAELPVVEEKPVVEEAVAPEEEKPVVASKASGKKKKSAKAK